MRILALSAEIPFPPISGGRQRTFYLLRALSRRHDLSLVAFDGGEQGSASFPLRVVRVPWALPPLYQEMYGSDVKASQRAYDKLENEVDEPWLASCFDSAAMSEALRTIAASTAFDLVLIMGTAPGRFLPDLPANRPKILNLYDVHSLMALQAVKQHDGPERERAMREAARVLRFERSLAARCDLSSVVSEVEAEAARRLLHVDNVEIVPNGVDTDYFTTAKTEPVPGYLLFTGNMKYAPNAEAVRYFCQSILPLIAEQLAEVRFHVAGDAPGREIRALSSKNVIIHGRVPDMRPYQHAAEVVVVPLLRGGGTRLKILEAAACGKAIVTTSAGVEGLALRADRDLVVADTAEDFARAIVTLCKDAGRRVELGRCAREAALPYDWELVASHHCRLVESVGQRLQLSRVEPGYG